MSWQHSLSSGLRRRLAAAYRQACLSELDALKPGNVHRFCDGHGMTLEDFITSADVSANPITSPGLGLGERIYRAVEATRDAVGCNTNLGIVLLCAPLIQALLDGQVTPHGSLRDGLRKVLAQADENETVWLFRAIQLAAPAGLGNSDRHDVTKPANAPLLEVMTQAAERDQIARQYTTGFDMLFDDALPRLRHFESRWQSREWAVTGLYLSLLSRYPDTHVQRKYGLYKAVSTSLHAAELDKGLARAQSPQHYQLRLLQADKEFKRNGINPGTTADMTVATLFILHLDSMMPAFDPKAGFSRDSDSQPIEVGVRS